MLRVSSQFEITAADVEAIVGGDPSRSSIPAAAELVAFAEAAITDDHTAIEQTRDAVESALGLRKTIEAAGIIANFQRMVRIADGTGIPLDPTAVEVTADLRDTLGLNSYGRADRTLDHSG